MLHSNHYCHLRKVQVWCHSLCARLYHDLLVLTCNHKWRKCHVFLFSVDAFPTTSVCLAWVQSVWWNETAPLLFLSICLLCKAVSIAYKVAILLPFSLKVLPRSLVVAITSVHVKIHQQTQQTWLLVDPVQQTEFDGCSSFGSRQSYIHTFSPAHIKASPFF